MPSPTEITVSQLARLIGLPQGPMLIDVRTVEEYAIDPRLIPGSVRLPAEEAAASSQGAGEFARADR
jgi:rhodanese-related sulfurtransferase